MRRSQRAASRGEWRSGLYLDTERFVLSHKFLPRSPAVDSLSKNWMTRSLRAARRRFNARPLAVPARYGRSSLLRIIPPLCLAEESAPPSRGDVSLPRGKSTLPSSVLSASRDLRLGLSLRIEATGSKVPYLSPIRARAALRPDVVSVADRSPPTLIPGPRLKPRF